MKIYIVRVYRAQTSNAESVSGVIEDIESDRNQPFHSISELQCLLAHSIGRGQLDFPDFSLPGAVTQEKNAVIGKQPRV